MNAIIDHRRDVQATAPRKPWMQTRSGRVFPLLACTPNDVHWPDVIYHLSMCNRFAGAAGAYSVAQHSVFVASLLPGPLKPYGLLHDAEEFAIGDVTQPTNQALIALGMDGSARGPLKRLKHHIRGVLHEAAGLRWPLTDEMEHEIKRADNIALATEKRDLLKEMPLVANEDWLHGVDREEPSSQQITAWHHSTAAWCLALALRNCGIMEKEL